MYKIKMSFEIGISYATCTHIYLHEYSQYKVWKSKVKTFDISWSQTLTFLKTKPQVLYPMYNIRLKK